MTTFEHLIDDDGYESICLTGVSHRLTAMPTEGTTWCALLAIESPSNAAQMTPEHAEAVAHFLLRQAARARGESAPTQAEPVESAPAEPTKGETMEHSTVALDAALDHAKEQIDRLNGDIHYARSPQERDRLRRERETLVVLSGAAKAARRI